MRISNTLTRSKQELAPLTPGEIRMYVCGVTVYDLSHIGHARSAIVFDVMRRYLEFTGYRVTFVKNFTDVDDKIIRRASEEGVGARDLAERYIAAYREDMAALGVRAPDHEPKATEHIPEMIALIERLVAGGFAYVVDGDVYFAVRRFPAYGRLSGRNLDELMVGARVEVDERKRDPRDFALWKTAKPGEPAWASPWGPGRPGWHIECSAMAMRYLGESFDIHGGGEDLIFPHHECEIAQSEAATGKPFVRVWVHNGFVNLGAEKMSKSLGNILTVRELVKRHDPQALRLWLLGTHYRSPVEWSQERVGEAARALRRLRGLVQEADRAGYTYADLLELREDGTLGTTAAAFSDDAIVRGWSGVETAFQDAMDDDFNTPAALAALFDLSRELNKYRDTPGSHQRRFAYGVAILVRLAAVLGLESFPIAEMRGPEGELRRQIEARVAQREQARKRRDWAEADKLRDELRELGVTVEDTPSGPHWVWKPPEP